VRARWRKQYVLRIGYNPKNEKCVARVLKMFETKKIFV
jgi:hypothetical protein